MIRGLTAGIVCLLFLALLTARTGVAATPETSAQRQNEEQAAEAKLNNLERSMQALEEESRRESQPREEINRLYEEFREHRDNARENLEKLRNATNEGWSKAREDMQRAIENLNGLYERTRARLRDKDKKN